MWRMGFRGKCRRWEGKGLLQYSKGDVMGAGLVWRPRRCVRWLVLNIFCGSCEQDLLLYCCEV